MRAAELWCLLAGWGSAVGRCWAGWERPRGEHGAEKCVLDSAPRTGGCACRVFTESQSAQVGGDPQGSSSPAPWFPKDPQKNQIVSESGAQTLVELQQAQHCDPCPGVPAPAPDHPLGAEPSPDIQREPPASQLRAVPSGPNRLLIISYHLFADERRRQLQEYLAATGKLKQPNTK